MKNETTIKDHSKEGHTRADKYIGQRCESHCYMIPLIFEVMMIMVTTTTDIAVINHYDGDFHHDD
jgi:hypothetical protein